MDRSSLAATPAAIETGPQIKNIETIVFRLPMHSALVWGAHSSLSELQHVLIQVTLGDGSIGYAEAPPRPSIYGETPQSIEWIIRTELAPRLIGCHVPYPAQHTDDGWLAPAVFQPITSRLQTVANNHTARGALDMAIHMALANSLQVPLARYVGAVQERIRVSYILGLGEQDALLAEAQRVVDHGVRVLKVKLGREWRRDVATAAALQTALGPSVELYADANECLRPDDALAALQQMADAGLRYCEEPLPVENLHARQALRASNCLPLIADDSTFTTKSLQRELDFDTFDILNIKTARTGFTESYTMQNMAQGANKGLMVGSQASAGIGTMLAGLFSARAGIKYPCELSFYLKLKEDVISKPLPIRDGYMWLDDIAQTQIDFDRLHDYTVLADVSNPPPGRTR